MQTSPEATQEAPRDVDRGYFNVPLGPERKARLIAAARAKEVTPTELMRRLVDKEIPAQG